MKIPSGGLSLGAIVTLVAVTIDGREDYVVVPEHDRTLEAQLVEQFEVLEGQAALEQATMERWRNLSFDPDAFPATRGRQTALLPGKG